MISLTNCVLRIIVMDLSDEIFTILKDFMKLEIDIYEILTN